tara:strand:- start:566 stop:1168 length:603 start_codon:yes stop_codon:yes gene_type:complete
MGTRNLTIILKNNEHKVAQYCQWDGYPDGQGLVAYNLLKGNLAVIEQSLDKCRWITEEDLKDVMRHAHEEADEEWDGETEIISFNVSHAIQSLYPHLQREHGALVLDTIINAPEEILLRDGIDFAADDLFCEYIWIVDFDKRVFQGLVPTKYLSYKAVENQESYLDTLDFDTKMTKVFESSLDDLPATEHEFIESFVRLE